MKKGKQELNWMWVAAVIVAFVLGVFIGPTVMKSAPTNPHTTISQSQADLNNAMRKLWEDHITWTRLYLVSAIAGAADTNNVAARLLKNQEDIGNAIKPYYGETAGGKLTELLKQHILIAGDLVTAAKTGDQQALTQANDKWYANADEIATFLATANPNLSADEMKDMMKTHLDLTKQEAVDMLQGNYDANIADYDKVHDEILHMADMLSTGIIQQFPNKFQ